MPRTWLGLFSPSLVQFQLEFSKMTRVTNRRKLNMLKNEFERATFSCQKIKWAFRSPSASGRVQIKSKPQRFFLNQPKDDLKRNEIALNTNNSSYTEKTSKITFINLKEWIQFRICTCKIHIFINSKFFKNCISNSPIMLKGWIFSSFIGDSSIGKLEFSKLPNINISDFRIRLNF